MILMMENLKNIPILTRLNDSPNPSYRRKPVSREAGDELGALDTGFRR